MRYHSFKSQHKKDLRHFKFIKMFSYLKAHIKFSFQKRKQSIEIFEEMYKHEHSFHDDNGLKNDQYYIPEAIVVLDIVSKKKLQEVKKGLKLLFKKYYSHKFLTGFQTDKDIDNLIEGLDLTISEGKSWHRIMRFDMENVSNLKKDISYFDIVIRNFSTSYLEIEFYIYFTEEKKRKLDQFTRTNYNAQIKSVSSAYSRNKKKSGAKINYGVGTYNDNQEKSELLYDEIEVCKYKFLKLMYKYFPLQLYGHGQMPIGIIVNKTNIHYTQKHMDFWSSVGIMFGIGVFANESLKLFPQYELYRRSHNIQTNYMLVYNDETLDNEYITTIYHGNKSHYIMEWLFENLKDIYKTIIIDDISGYYNKKCAYYRNLINKIKARKRNYARLLKLRYHFHLAFIMMTQINKELDLKKLEEQTEKYFQDKFMIKYDKYMSHKQVSTYPIRRFVGYMNSKNILEERLNEKIILSEELKTYAEGKKNWGINLITFFIGVGTFLFLIFPAWASSTANLLLMVWRSLCDLF